MKKILILFITLSISLNIILFYIIVNPKKALINTLQTNKENSLRLISPVKQNFIDSNIEGSINILHYSDLKPKIEQEIAKYKAENNLAIFIHDAQTGAFLGLNEKEGFAPASLLKIPILMGILKKVDREEIKLTDEIILISDDLDKDAGALYQKGAGTKISIWDLLKVMILTSDNTAKNALKRQLMDEELNAVFAHVGIPNPYLQASNNLVSTRGYTRIFKSLYLASFLSPELSQKALDISTDTQVENLISAGVPPEVQVAHKYGERPDGLADCGIIYEAKNPYFICIMTRDLEITQAKTLISSLSKITYDFVSTKK